MVAPKSIEDTVTKMRANNEVSFTEALNVCIHYFGEYRVKGAHHIFSMPWPGDPRVNLQSDKGKAKRYQTRQVIAAIDRLAAEKLKSEKPKKK